MGLPSHSGKEGEQEEASYDSHPNGDGSRDGEYDNRQPGHHYRQGSAKGENGSRSPYDYGIRRAEKDVEDIPQNSSGKIDQEKIPLSDQSGQGGAKEEQGYHIEQDVADEISIVDEKVGYDGPRSLPKDVGLQAERIKQIFIYLGHEEDSEVYTYQKPDKNGDRRPVAFHLHLSSILASYEAYASTRYSPSLAPRPCFRAVMI